jgi:Calcineurin-like phosphoesterase
VTLLSLLASAFLAVGDFGVGGARQRATGEAIRAFEEKNPAELLVTLGDNDYTRSPQRFAAAWRASFGWLPAAGVDVAGALGNHDVEVARGRYEFALLGMPAPYYVRRLEDVDVFVLDSTAVTRAQTRWLTRALAASRARWKVAVFHHPPYTCGGHSGSSTIRRVWSPLFQRHGVRLVLSGHDHNYQRFAPRGGVTHVVHGGGGARLYWLKPCPRGYPRRVGARVDHGFLHVTSDAQRLLVAAVGLDGRVIDRVTIGAVGAVQAS